MKIFSTSGALLLEKNIGFDLDGDEVVSVISNPNTEEMFIALLTRKGKLIRYKVTI
jgi:hypothetical protein